MAFWKRSAVAAVVLMLLSGCWQTGPGKKAAHEEGKSGSASAQEAETGIPSKNALDTADQVVIKVLDKDKNAIFQYTAPESAGIYEKYLTKNGKYGYVQFSEAVSGMAFFDVYNNKTIEYKYDESGDDHSSWISCAMSETGLGEVIENHDLENKLIKTTVYSISFTDPAYKHVNKTIEIPKKVLYYNPEIEGSDYQDMMFSIKYLNEVPGLKDLNIIKRKMGEYIVYMIAFGDKSVKIDKVLQDEDLKDRILKFCR